jgi:hypothetical protein
MVDQSTFIMSDSSGFNLGIPESDDFFECLPKLEEIPKLEDASPSASSGFDFGADILKCLDRFGASISVKLEYAPSNEEKKKLSTRIYPHMKTLYEDLPKKKCEYPGCKLGRDRDSIRYFGENKIKVCIFHFYEAQCSKCFKFFTYETLKKYDGITCGRCYHPRQ